MWIVVVILLCIIIRVYFGDGLCIAVMLSEYLLMFGLYRFDTCHLNYLSACLK